MVSLSSQGNEATSYTKNQMEKEECKPHVRYVSLSVRSRRDWGKLIEDAQMFTCRKFAENCWPLGLKVHSCLVAGEFLT